MRRFVIYDHLGNVVREVSPNDVFTLTRREKINGEHCLEITTTQVLEKGQRIVYQDGRGCWREYVVSGVDTEHVAGKTVLGVYYCTWSLQSDLLGVTVSKMPGVQTPVTAANALADALSTQVRWTVGTVTNTNTGGASMYDMSAWKALGVLIENWKGELSTSFDVDVSGNITARRVDYYAQMGEQTAKRRFDFGADVKSIKRKYDDEPLYCRVSPRGAGEQTAGGGYGRKITIESVNDGKDYLVYAPMVDVAKLPDGNGGWQYPTVIIENSNCKTPTELKTWAQSVLEESCTPKVTYEIDVYEAAIEGVDAQGVSLGDAVQVVDRKFGADGIRLQARVIELAVDELNERNVTVTLGYVDDGLAGQFADGARAFSMVTNLSNTLSTAQYVKDLISRMNDEINATGGYTYITEGQGIRAYDVAVTDPLIGAEASKVVEIKGGSIRIADSKTAQGEWEWKTVFVSGHIAAELVTAVQITAGYIGNASSGSYWDLDNNNLRIGTGAEIGSTTAGTLVSDTATAKSNASTALADAATAQSTAEDAKKVATNYLTYDSTNGLDIGYSGTSAKTRINGSGIEMFDGQGVSALSAKIENNVSTVRVGRASSAGNVELSSKGYVDLKRGSTILAHFGYESGTNASGGTSIAPYYDLGTRRSNSTIGNYSVVEGGGSSTYDGVSHTGNIATGYCSHAEGVITSAKGFGAHSEGFYTSAKVVGSHAEGSGSIASGTNSHAEGSGCEASNSQAHAEGGSTKASGNSSHAEGRNTEASEMYAHAEGDSTKASGLCSHAEGGSTIASGRWSHAGGYGTVAYGECQTVIGKYNSSNSTSLFIVGNGNSDNKRNAFAVASTRVDMFTSTFQGTVYVNGSSVHSSDRRLKRHESYLSDDACEMVRNLKPVLFTRNGAKHYGFYAQDVRDVDEHDTATVLVDDYDEQLGFAPLSLDYSALIAPLVAYAQSLERRIEHLESVIARLEGDAK